MRRDLNLACILAMERILFLLPQRKFYVVPVIFKTLFVKFIGHSEGAVTVVVVAIYIPRVYFIFHFKIL